MRDRPPRIGVRWTVGDVSDRGFEALRLSIWGVWRVLGDSAAYAVCVNTIPARIAEERAGHTPGAVRWHDTSGDIPLFLSERLGDDKAEGVGWKFAPLRCFPDLHELSLDNDCILWSLPPTIRRWLASGDPRRCVMAEDVRTAFGRFADLCPRRPLNAGIRGFPPGFDLAAALHETLHDADRAWAHRIRLESELDEQGLQAAALSRHAPPAVVTLEEVTVCSPFHPHLPHLGRCGAHFVGLNADHIPWDYFDRPADAWMDDHWRRHRRTIDEILSAHAHGDH